MANNQVFKIKNGLQAGRYLQSNGTETAGTVGYNYDLAGASYDGVSYNVSGQDANPMKLKFNLDGTKMFILGFTSDSVFQYSLSTGFDLSTASYDNVSFSVSSQEASPSGLDFNNDGTKMYVCGFSSDTVFEYSLSTSFDLSTALYRRGFSTSSQETAPRCIYFNNDGTKMYIGGTDNDTVFQYSLSTGFTVTTASYDNISFNVGTQASVLYDIGFNLDGTKMFVMDEASKTVYQYDLSTGFDLSTASYSGVSFSAAGQDTQTRGLTFNDDGTKLYIIAAGTDTAYQYSTVGYTQTLDLSTGTTFSFTPSGATTVSFTNPPASGTAVGFTVEINGDGSAITWPSSVKWPTGTAPTATATKELYAFVTTDGGTTYYGKKAAEGVA